MRPIITSIIWIFITISIPAFCSGSNTGKPAAIRLSHNVKLIPYTTQDTGTKSAACIICPGGSYFWLDKETEGHKVASWLQCNGISAFVLEYRHGGIPAFVTHQRHLFNGGEYPDMLEDLSNALTYIHTNADSLNINVSRIGVMGFSAGGHLALMSGIFFGHDYSRKTKDTYDIHRPDFIAAIYPVVTMSSPVTHRRSRRGLLGERRMNDPLMRDSLSIEKHIGPDMPPVFIINCIDDPIVDYRNSVLLDSALNNKCIPHRYIQYSTGGHGFGADDNKTAPELKQWRAEFLNWLDSIR